MYQEQLILTDAQTRLVEPYFRIKNGEMPNKDFRPGRMKSAHAKKMRLKLSEAQNHRCGGCGVRFHEDHKHPAYATFEHFICQAYGGTNSWYNLALTCVDCNSKRGCSIEDVIEVYG